MASITTTEARPGQGAGAARPYTPSWVDMLTDGVRRLPVPAWLVYLGLAAGSTLLVSAIGWSEGLYPVGTLDPLGVLIGITPFYALALMHYLDDWARAALARFRPALAVEDAEYERLLYQFTTLPARPVLLASLIGALYGLSIILSISDADRQEMHLPTSQLGIGVQLAFSILSYACAAIMVYHTIRQLRMVSRIYTTQTRIDLFQLTPWYALSELTARPQLASA